jgi:hypothetical protein
MSTGPYSATPAAVVLTAALLAACSAEPECPVPDRVETVHELRAGGTPLFLVYRVSGAHDKVEFYELYAAPPQFDRCGHAADKPLAQEVIDRDQGRIKDVIVRGTALEIRYTRQAAEGVEPPKAKLSRE